ncbi:DMT family transporter [Indioceanicola profundi]|uniref:DMT family transporter n=1 Tax=Indioceanicola profundi TaxID=2220096 RepID=UPI000E6AA220|nr:DMT family transporter [Indioceanicola profundi]
MSTVTSGTEEKIAGGIMLAVGAFALYSMMDVAVKLLAGRYAVPQIIFFNCIFSLLPILAYAAMTGGVVNNVRTRRPGMHMLRSGISVVGGLCTYFAYSRMPIADAYALAFTAPLFITALSVPILGEQVGWRRWTAVGVGFAGVLVMLRPGAGVIDIGAFASLGGALCYSVNMLIARMMRGTEKPVSFAFYATVVNLLANGLLLSFVWVPPTLQDIGVHAAVGLIGGCAVIALLTAFRQAPAAVVAPFQYSQMAWGVLSGYLIWGYVPDIWLGVGAAIVIGSGLYILYRETVVGRGVAAKVVSPAAGTVRPVAEQAAT